MKKIIVLSVLSLCISTSYAAKKTEQKMTVKDSLAYALGVTVGTNVKQQFADINIDVFTKGLADIFKNAENMPFKNNEEAMMFLNNYFEIGRAHV